MRWGIILHRHNSIVLAGNKSTELTLKKTAQNPVGPCLFQVLNLVQNTKLKMFKTIPGYPENIYYKLILSFVDILLPRWWRLLIVSDQIGRPFSSQQPSLEQWRRWLVVYWPNPSRWPWGAVVSCVRTLSNMWYVKWSLIFKWFQ